MYLSSCNFFLLLGLVSSYPFQAFRVNAIVPPTEDQQLPNGQLATATPISQDSPETNESHPESSQQAENTPIPAPSETQVQIPNNPIMSAIAEISPASYPTVMTDPPPHGGPEVVSDDSPTLIETEVQERPPEPTHVQATIRPALEPTTNPRSARRRLDFSDPTPLPNPITRDESGDFSSTGSDDHDVHNGPHSIPMSMEATPLVENASLVMFEAGEASHPAPNDNMQQITIVPRNDSPIVPRPIVSDEVPTMGSVAPKKRSGEDQDPDSLPTVKSPSLRPRDFNREASPIKGSPPPQGSPRIPGKQLDVPAENQPSESPSKKSDPFPRECSTSPTKKGKRSVSPNRGPVIRKTPEPDEKKTSPRKSARSRAVSPTSGRPIRSAQDASDTKDRDMENLVGQQSSNFDVLGKRRYKHENHRSRLNAQVDDSDEKPKRRRIFKRLRPDTDDNSNIILWTIGATVVMFTLSALAFMLLRKAAPPKTGPNGVRRPSVIPIDL